MLVGPAANALSGLMCEYGESDEDSDDENDKQTHNEDHGGKDERMSSILLVSGSSPIKNGFLASTVWPITIQAYFATLVLKLHVVSFMRFCYLTLTMLFVN